MSTNGLFTKTLYNSHNQGLGKKMEYVNKKIPSVTVITTALNAKAIDAKNKVPDIINISTKGYLTTKAKQIEKKILDTSHFINPQK